MKVKYKLKIQILKKGTTKVKEYIKDVWATTLQSAINKEVNKLGLHNYHGINVKHMREQGEK